MSNANEPAFPVVTTEINANDVPYVYSAGGMTKREYYAGLAMQAIVTGAVTRACPSHEWADVQIAVKIADALLAALEKKK